MVSAKQVNEKAQNEFGVSIVSAGECVVFWVVALFDD